jgi:hypothetical protein
VIAYDENGCKNSASVSVTLVGIADVSGNGDLLIFPNPAGSRFSIQLTGAMPENPLQYKCSIRSGRLFFRSRKNRNHHVEKEIKASQLTAGIYFVEVKTGDRFWRRKMVISE